MRNQLTCHLLLGCTVLPVSFVRLLPWNCRPRPRPQAANRRDYMLSLPYATCYLLGPRRVLAASRSLVAMDWPQATNEQLVGRGDTPAITCLQMTSICENVGVRKRGSRQQDPTPRGQLDSYSANSQGRVYMALFFCGGGGERAASESK